MENLEKVKQLAPNLQQEEPRAKDVELGGFKMAARALDKCRAELAGTAGEFHFNCPMDQRFFGNSGIGAESFREFVASGASDQEVEEWIRTNATAPAPQ